ncbi:LpxI family protein [Candidatus Entotheonella palauensis]|uniref:LpxI family protein n=1 Tax=Candidatus Entotheonella palauensis TaxID=93172 RepID=UPI0011780E9F|nr:UDP-2,3-diacylglucosamine diphosphatase LpxI [Candidatus Entotheonella palauensis]
MQNLGMIAGAGEFPLLIARQAHESGCPLPTIALSAQVAAGLMPYCQTLAQYGPGQVTKILRELHKHGVKHVVIVGKVHKQFLFEKPRLDLRALRLLRQLRDYRDGALFQAMQQEFAREGIDIVEQTQLLGHLLTPAGVLGTRRPSAREWVDIRYGFAQAKQVVALDIGQTLVVRHRTVLAVEAVEGTDAAIQRGCRLGRRGAVVIKVSRPQQDFRFDIPAVGPDTLREVIAGQARVLAVEAGSTLMLHRDDLVASANAHRVSVVGVTPQMWEAEGAGR